MKPKRNSILPVHPFNMKPAHFLFPVLLVLAISCNNPSGLKLETIDYDEDVKQSQLLDTDTAKVPDFIVARWEEFKKVLQLPVPVLLCKDTLNVSQQLAQSIAIHDSAFMQTVKDASTGSAYRCEIFGIYPARESDMAGVKTAYQLADCYRVEMYNYATNTASVAVTDNQQRNVIATSFQNQAQPDIPAYLKKLAIKIAAQSEAVQTALGIKPSESDALMANTKTALNRTRCERSRHLCVAPTFIKGGKALWVIVDLTECKLAGIRWTNVGTTGPAAPITERKLQDDKITACFCEKETALEKDGWKMDYMITSSDGLRISQVSYNGVPVLQSAKLVDWHVSYSGTDGFGYSDAVGCPYFSQAAVVALSVPKVAVIKDDKNVVTGFVLEQTFRSDGWPQPCNYNYLQRYEFYKDGRFRIAAASLGRGCGNDGTYRPVFRIAFADNNNNIAEWTGDKWTNWKQENWQLQKDITNYTAEGWQYKLFNSTGNGFYLEPGKGQFGDGGRGDNAFVFATLNKQGIDEGESDLVTIGPCCNTDYRQGPEKFMEPVAENIEGKKLVLWYVAQLKNDDSKGREYCWAESVLQNGVYVTKSYPCFCGPMFIPVNKKLAP